VSHPPANYRGSSRLSSVAVVFVNFGPNLLLQTRQLVEDGLFEGRLQRVNVPQIAGPGVRKTRTVNDYRPDSFLVLSYNSVNNFIYFCILQMKCDFLLP
jgi:hypothetical protein